MLRANPTNNKVNLECQKNSTKNLNSIKPIQYQAKQEMEDNKKEI